jgi:hypothetical protein
VHVGLGDASRHFGNLSRKVIKHYRGQRMLNATLSRIAKDLLNAKSKVIVAGNDGGGFLLYIQADRIGEQLRTVAGFPQNNYAVLPIEGCVVWPWHLLWPIWCWFTPCVMIRDSARYWPNWNGYYEGFALQQVITGRQDTKQHQVSGGNAWDFMNFSGAVNPACVRGIDPSGTKPETHWRCLLPEVAGQ